MWPGYGDAMDSLRDVPAAIVGTQSPPAIEAVWATGVVALLVVLWSPSWAISRHVITIAHEGAHAVAALLSGRRLSGIRLHSDSSGLTVSKGKRTGPGMVATAFAGYVGPAVLGLAAAYLLSREHALGVLWGSLLLLALLLLQIRNFYGLYAVLVAGGLVFAVSWFGSEQVQSLTAYVGTWFLLIAAPKPVLELQTQRRRGGAGGSDADALARLTKIPGLVWVGIFLVANLGALALGGWLILRPV